MMKNVRTLAVTLLLSVASLAPLVTGCSGAEQHSPQTSASAVTKAPIAPNTHGLVKLVGEALGDVALRPEQRTELEKLAAAAEARHLAMIDGRKELMGAVADQVEKGSIDRAALQPKIDRVVAEGEKVRPDDRAALVKVHALLDTEQRNAFVDALEARMKGKHEGAKGKHRGGPRDGFAKMKQLADDLKLTEEQRDQIKTVMKEGHKEGGRGGHPMGADFRERMHAGKGALESFRTDKFEPAEPRLDGKKVDLREKAAEGTTRMIGMAEKLLPILNAEQRKLAADKIREVAASGEAGPFGH
jgi:Spy/CpxP family protein refolding chaperone